MHAISYLNLFLHLFSNYFNKKWYYSLQIGDSLIIDIFMLILKNNWFCRFRKKINVNP
jgi:hypothetical protein